MRGVKLWRNQRGYSVFDPKPPENDDAVSLVSWYPAHCYRCKRGDCNHVRAVQTFRKEGLVDQ